MNKEFLKGHSELIILAALAKQPMHGYALSEYIQTEASEMFKFGVGMLYPLLHRLEQRKLIQGRWVNQKGSDRRVYSLTIQGKRILTEKRNEWRQFSQMMEHFIHSMTISHKTQ